MKDQAQMTLQREDSAKGLVLYMAMELSEKKWKLLFSDGEFKPNGQLRVYQKSIEGNDWVSLAAALERAKERFKMPAQVSVLSCYEAGQEGFWVHRQLAKLGVVNRVVDSASIEVNRRYRRVKTDRLDVRKLLEMLVRVGRGESGVWREVRVPSVEAEDRRRLHRELERLKKEDRQHRTRIRSLLKLHGQRTRLVPGARGWEQYLESLKSLIPERACSEVVRQTERLRLVKAQMRMLQGEQRAAIEQASEEDEVLRKVMALALFRGIGLGSAWLLVMEFFGWRDFKNRRQVAGCAGLDPTPYDSGQSRREQGISKAGSKRIRWLMVELAWSWLRFQPHSGLSGWFRKRFGAGGKRQRRIGIVALARRLLVALWSYLENGVVPEGVEFKVSV